MSTRHGAVAAIAGLQRLLQGLGYSWVGLAVNNGLEGLYDDPRLTYSK